MKREVDGLARLVEAGLAMVNELPVTSDAKPPVAPIDVNEVIRRVRRHPGDRRTGRARRNVIVAGDSRVYARQVDLDRILLNSSAMPPRRCPREVCW